MVQNNYYKETTDFRTIFAWIAYMFVNAIFCIKYNPFDEILPLFLIVVYPVVVFFIYKATSYLHLQQKNVFFIFSCLFIFLLAGFLLYNVDKWSVTVDRWSALSFWSENLKNGKFPYGTPTHVGGYASPFPVWQIFHFPFHLMGDTFYAEILCLLIFFIFLFVNRTRMNIGGIVLLMILSPAFWWEITVRSDLLCNMLLVFIFIASNIYNERFWEKKKYLIALIIGLFLCTKLLTGIPLFLFFFPRFVRYTTKDKIFSALIIAAGFIAPFLPFLFGEHSLLNHPEYNPMLQQTRQGSLITVVVGLALMIVASLYWRTLRQCFFFAGLFLFALVFSVAATIWYANGMSWEYLLFADEMDISYFNVSLPFFLYCINEGKTLIFKYSHI